MPAEGKAASSCGAAPGNEPAYPRAGAPAHETDPSSSKALRGVEVKRSGSSRARAPRVTCHNVSTKNRRCHGLSVRRLGSLPGGTWRLPPSHCGWWGHPNHRQLHQGVPGTRDPTTARSIRCLHAACARCDAEVLPAATTAPPRPVQQPPGSAFCGGRCSTGSPRQPWPCPPQAQLLGSKPGASAKRGRSGTCQETA
jgi:hypothetical protein